MSSRLETEVQVVNAYMYQNKIKINKSQRCQRKINHLFIFPILTNCMEFSIILSNY